MAWWMGSQMLSNKAVAHWQCLLVPSRLLLGGFLWDTGGHQWVTPSHTVGQALLGLKSFVPQMPFWHIFTQPHLHTIESYLYSSGMQNHLIGALCCPKNPSRTGKGKQRKLELIASSQPCFLCKSTVGWVPNMHGFLAFSAEVSLGSAARRPEAPASIGSLD